MSSVKKKLLLLLFSLILSFNSYGEWTIVLPGNNASLYIDFETLEEREGFIYWWYMDSWSDGSAKSYAQGDCNLKGFKVNKRVNFSLPMGVGEGIENNVVSSWEYYQPNTGYEVLLNFICQMSKLAPEEQKKRIEALTNRNEEFERERKRLVKEPEEESSLQLNIIKSPYIKSVEANIKSFWRYQGAEDHWSCDVLISQAVKGAVEAVKILGCDIGNNENPAMSKSKAQAFGASIRRAAFRSSPLPLPQDEAVFDKEIMFKFSVK
jgi:hypothetical protein